MRITQMAATPSSVLSNGWRLLFLLTSGFTFDHVSSNYFIKARETTQRSMDNIRKRDVHIMKTFQNNSVELYADLDESSMAFSNLSAYAAGHKVVDIFSEPFTKEDDEYIRAETGNTYNVAVFYLEPAVPAISAIDTVLSTLLGWNGSHSSFEKVLQDCQALINTSLPVSEPKTKNISETTAAINVDQDYGSTECHTMITQKREYVSGGKQKLDSDIRIFGGINKSGYDDIVFRTFNNSLKTPDAVQYHKDCTLAFDTAPAVNQTLQEIYEYLEDFINATTLDELILNSTARLTNLMSMESYTNVKYGLTSCSWIPPEIYTQYSTSRINDKIVITKTKQDNLLHAVAAYINVLNTINDTRVTMEEVREMVIRYLEGNVTKMNLAQYLGSPLLSGLSSNMASLFQDAHNRLIDIESAIKHLLDEVAKLYDTLFQWPVPVLRLPQVYKLHLFDRLMSVNRTDVDTIFRVTPTDLSVTLEQAISLVKADYRRILYGNGITLQDYLKKQADQFTELRAELATYASESTINSAFFMENFLQLDIFYKDMTYEQISQQPAFSLPSLFGEVGGFMGLLLGASIMTVCELLDYVIMCTVRLCKNRSQRIASHSCSVYAVGSKSLSD